MDRQGLQGNHADTARLLGVTPEALRKMVRDRGCPVLRKGNGNGAGPVYDWVKVVAWRVQDAATGKGALTEAREALVRAQAAKVTRTNAHAAGDLVSISGVERLLSGMLVVLRNTLLGLPTTMAPELAGESDPNVIKAALDREIRHALEAVSNIDPRKLPTNSRRGTGGTPQRTEKPNGE